MTTNNETKGRGSAPWIIGALAALALVPSGYLYFTGSRDRAELTGRVTEAEATVTALADSLDAARTQLLVDRVMVLVRSGETAEALDLASDFFDRVDRRSRAPGASTMETETRLRVLAFRDQTISALSRGEPAALRLVEEIASLHLPLGEPALGVRIPAPSSVGAGMPPGDTSGGGTAPPDSAGPM